MRLVFLDDINRKKEEAQQAQDQAKTVSNTQSLESGGFEHGGKGDLNEFAMIAKEHGLETVMYYKGFKFESDDIIYFCDRQILHFYDGWKMLREAGVLKRTIAVLIESDVVDRKCGVKVLKAIKNAFPVFLTYQDDLVDDKKFYKIWPSIDINTGDPASSNSSVGDSAMKTDTKTESKPLLASMITTKQVHSENPGEQYSERIKIADWFEAHPEYGFKVFGRGWEGYSINGGIINKKSEAYGNSKFAFCIENCRRNGYITEKIFDCLKEGIVPIYSGAPNTKEYIPEECFIDYDSFSSVEELVRYLNEMDEVTYKKHLDAIGEFLRTDLTGFSQKTLFKAVDHEFGDFKPDLGSKINMFFKIREHERYLYYSRLIKRKFNR